MVLLIVIIVALALQLTGYILIDKRGFARWLKICILMAALVFHIVLLPMVTISLEYSSTSTPHCGMPAMSIVLISWIFGALPTLLEFGIYQIVSKSRLKKVH